MRKFTFKTDKFTIESGVKFFYEKNITKFGNGAKNRCAKRLHWKEGDCACLRRLKASIRGKYEDFDKDKILDDLVDKVIENEKLKKEKGET